MDTQETGALAAISEVAASLPAPIETSFVKAIGNLLGGLTAIPAAWVKRPAQAIDDITASRSTVAAILAKGAAEEALKDPVVMQAAAEVYLPTAVRKAKNRVQIAQRAAEHLADAKTEGSKAASPTDDWMNSFARFAEDASSEHLQDLFARILAGEVVQPGSFGLATLRAVAELDQAIAEDFSMVWARSVGQAVDYTPDYSRGEWFARWRRLVESGLMASAVTVQYLPSFHPVIRGNGMWMPLGVEGMHLMVEYSEGCRVQWEHIGFTRVGRQMGSILPRPDYEANIREAGKRLVGPGVVRVVLQSANKPEEEIYLADGS